MNVPGGSPGAVPPALEPRHAPVPVARWVSWLGLQDFRWSVALIGLCVFTFSIVTYRLAAGDIGIAVALAAVLFRRERIRVTKPVWLFALFLAWAFCAGLVATYPAIAIDTLMERSKILVIMLVVVNTLRTEGQVRFYLLFFLACFVIYPVRGTLLGGETVFGRAIWGTNMYQNPNDLAALSLFPLGIALAIFYSSAGRKLLRLATAGSAMLLLVVILLTQSRGAFVGLLAGMGLAFVALGLKHPVRSALAGLVAAAIIAIAVPATAWQRFAGIGELRSAETAAQADPEGSAAERLEIAQTALRIVADNPIFGVGLGAYGGANARYNPELGRKSTHNTYLNLAAEVGIPGMLIWIALPLSTLLYARRMRKRAPPGPLAETQAWIERSLWAYLVAAIFGTFSNLTFPYLFLAVVWCTATLLAPPQPAASGAAKRA